MSALDELHALRSRAEQARVEVATAERVRQSAPRRYEQARAALRGYHAGVAAGAAPDPDREQELTAELSRLGADVSTQSLGNGLIDVRDQAAEERLLRAQTAVHDAERELEAFRWTKVEALAADLSARARDLAERYRPIGQDVARLEREYSELLAAWRSILEPLGLTVADLPESPAQSTRFTTVMPPMPITLMQPSDMSPAVRAHREADEAARRERERHEQAAADLEAERGTASAAQDEAVAWRSAP